MNKKVSNVNPGIERPVPPPAPQKTCGRCIYFSDCFETSNSIMGVKSEHVTEKMVNEAGKIPACKQYMEAVK